MFPSDLRLLYKVTYENFSDSHCIHRQTDRQADTHTHTQTASTLVKTQTVDDLC